MNTRFDNEKEWITENKMYEIEEMETTHLLNTIRMLYMKPNSVTGMLIRDIEKSEEYIENLTPWTGLFSNRRNVKKESIKNVTSMTSDELVNYIMNTPLVNSMKKELENRGVNVEAIIEKIKNGDGGAF